MQKNPLFSIIIPVYNGANYVKEAIESALNQSYLNKEIIIVNDGSSDNGDTESIIQTFKNKIIYLYKENGGVASALNLGLKKMKGEYFIWLSHDDVLEKNRIKSDMEVLKKFPEAKITFCKTAVIDENSKITKKK